MSYVVTQYIHIYEYLLIYHPYLCVYIYLRSQIFHGTIFILLAYSLFYSA